MKKYVFIFMLLVVFLSTSACDKILYPEMQGDKSVQTVSSEDEEMNLIIDEARQSVNEFLSELNNPNTEGTDFSIKYPFDTDPGSPCEVEHMWIVDLENSDGKYFGILSNEPYYIKSMKMGDRIEFDINMVSDWKYVKDGYLVGGESIIYFYNQMSENEKSAFEKDMGFKIRKE